MNVVTEEQVQLSTAGSSRSGVVREFDPLQDLRWPQFVKTHPNASVFHTVGWLKALKEAYSYEPVGITTSQASEPLANVILLCRIRSFLTGNRITSLPFSDHCDPLVSDEACLQSLLMYLSGQLSGSHRKYVELRPREEFDVPSDTGFSPAKTYAFHILDLRRSLADLYNNFHKSCVQRKIKKAEREGVQYEVGASEDLLRKFYSLMLLTRRKQQLPPQPLSWFRALLTNLAGVVKIRVASRHGELMAAIMTLEHKQTMVYKYGCSDPALTSLGGTPLLFWRAIQEAKSCGLEELDFGRSDSNNPGLIAFKEHFGAKRSALTYYMSPSSEADCAKGSERKIPASLLKLMPDYALKITGKVLYRHFG